jgi:hypothetical protein
MAQQSGFQVDSTTHQLNEDADPGTVITQRPLASDGTSGYQMRGTTIFLTIADAPPTQTTVEVPPTTLTPPPTSVTPPETQPVTETTSQRNIQTNT